MKVTTSRRCATDGRGPYHKSTFPMWRLGYDLRRTARRQQVFGRLSNNLHLNKDIQTVLFAAARFKYLMRCQICSLKAVLKYVTYWIPASPSDKVAVLQCLKGLFITLQVVRGSELVVARLRKTQRLSLIISSGCLRETTLNAAH